MVNRIVGEYHFGTVNFKVIVTVLARVACTDHASNTHFVSYFNFLHLAPYFCHFPNDFMSANKNFNVTIELGIFIFIIIFVYIITI